MKILNLEIFARIVTTSQTCDWYSRKIVLKIERLMHKLIHQDNSAKTMYKCLIMSINRYYDIIFYSSPVANIVSTYVPSIDVGLWRIKEMNKLGNYQYEGRVL